MSFKNIKSGDVYDVLAVGLDCTNSRTGTKVIVYIRKCWWVRLIRALLAPRLVFVRDRGEFIEKFDF